MHNIIDIFIGEASINIYVADFQFIINVDKTLI